MIMASNRYLHSAARDKNDEFYTQYSDIQRELNCYYDYDKNFLRGKTVLLPCDDPEYSNFTKFFARNFKLYGLKKLISTGCAEASKNFSRGKIYTLDANGLANVDCELDARNCWQYLEGDGDFRSDEVTRLRDEADVIITNPPFSLFRAFLKWILAADKKFLIIGNINCITYKEVFPLIKQNKIWLGNGMGRWISGFIVPDDYELYGTEARVDEDGNRIIATNQCLWLTNIEHGRRHKPLRLMTYADCELYNPKIRGVGFQRYDNYNAIEVPFVDAIPADYAGVMGVPITFLDKYCPEQFEILGHTSATDLSPAVEALRTDPKNRNRGIVNGQTKYDRLLIKIREQ